MLWKILFLNMRLIELFDFYKQLWHYSFLWEIIPGVQLHLWTSKEPKLFSPNPLDIEKVDIPSQLSLLNFLELGMLSSWFKFRKNDRIRFIVAAEYTLIWFCLAESVSLYLLFLSTPKVLCILPIDRTFQAPIIFVSLQYP